MMVLSRIFFMVLACFMLASLGCSPAAATLDPATETAAPVLEAPGSTAAAPVASELSEEEILEIVRSSLAAFPWRLEQSILVKETGQTIVLLTEAQSSTRGYSRSAEPAGAEPITIETILFDSQVYMKITGGSVAETYGIADGQWAEVLPDSPLAQFVDAGAIDPARIAELFITDFAALSGQAGVAEMVFQLADSEEVNGVPADIYEFKGETFTYRWWISADRRLQKTTADLPEATRTILIEYDPSIDIQPPLP